MPSSSGFEIFRDSRGSYRRARWSRGIALVLVLGCCLVLAGNAWWLLTSLDRPQLEQELEEHARTSAERTQLLERLRRDAGNAQEGLDRLLDADAQLREMIRLDKEARQAANALPQNGADGAGVKTLLERLEISDAFVRALSRPARPVRLEAPALLELIAHNAPPMPGAVPDAWPVKGVLSSEFGVRLSPFAGREEVHRGVDIMAPEGSPVRAPAPGKVCFSGRDEEGTLAVVLDHGGGYVTTYSHLQRLDVGTGESVERGEQLGAVGQDGRSTGPHLHYEVRLYGVPVNPASTVGAAR